MKHFVHTLAALLLFSAPALAQQTPLKVGDAAGNLIVATDSLGREATFANLKGERGLVLLFTRSADWCQYCITQLKDWNNYVDDVQNAGYGLAALSYDAVGTIAKFEQASHLRYMLLSDTQSKVINAFGIRNENFAEGSRFYGIPNPAIYVIGADGVITHVFSEEGFKERPKPSDVLSALSAQPLPDTDSGEPSAE